MELESIAVATCSNPPRPMSRCLQSSQDPNACIKSPALPLPTLALDSDMGSLTEASPTCLLRPRMGVAGGSRNHRGEAATPWLPSKSELLIPEGNI